MTSTRLIAELKQGRPFDSAEEEAFLQILRTAEVVSRGMAEVLKPFDLTLTQYNVLRILRGAGRPGLRCAEISDRLITHDPDITRLLDRLERRRLIRRARDPRDRRAVLATITAAGSALLGRLDDSVKEAHVDLLKHLSHADLKDLSELLERARDRPAAQVR